uniref:Dihydroorotate dehydrogenase (quinone), mitochondrial n=1 Tax=Panagrellus redivivus TaxID=6233 RepID=A0A7E4V007_PANRE
MASTAPSSEIPKAPPPPPPPKPQKAYFRPIYSSLPPGYITKSTAIIVVGGIAAYTGIELLCGSEAFYSGALKVVQKYVDGETSHQWAVRMAKWGVLPKCGENLKEYDSLKTDVFGKQFSNPIGIAAGFDKDGEAIRNLRRSGIGFVEVGSITPRPQLGNPKPRVFRLAEDEGVINRYGFNSKGAGPISEIIKKQYEPEHPVAVGINLGKNKTSADAATDYEIGIERFAPLADYLVVNVSSPNTPGLRALQSKKELGKLLQSVKDALDVKEKEIGRRPPLLLKIAPDLTYRDKHDIAQLAIDKSYGIDGLIVSNTTITRPETLQSPNKTETGGLSGRPVREISTEVVGEMYQLTGGKVPIVGCGGVSSGQDAYEKIRAGASLVQLYTALVYQGFPVIGRVKRELAECLERDGFASVADAVGADYRSKVK